MTAPDDVSDRYSGMEPIAFASIATEPFPRAIRTLWRVGVVTAALVFGAAAIAVGVLAGNTVLLLVLVAVVAVLAGGQWWAVELRYRHFRWGLDDRWIERRSGVLVRRTQIVPRNRVQTLTTRTGPLDRRLGLSSIVVHTAGTHTPNLTIPHLEQGSADRIRAELGV